MADDATREPDHDGENGTCFAVKKPFRPDQLMGEVAQAMNWRRVSGCVVDGDASAASPESPVLVWVERADVEEGVFKSVVREHALDPAWTATPSEATIDDIRDKASRGEALTPDEQQAALRALLLASG